MLSVKNVSKNYGDFKALDNIDLEFKKGLNFIVGPSGSGKTTLLKLLGGMDKEFEGDIIYNNENIKNFDKSKMNDYYFNGIGFVWQSYQLINYLPVEDNVKIVLQLTDMTEEEKNKKVGDVLKRLKIYNLSKNSVNTLSGGQQQRVAIARALVKDPEVILADEPTGALDEKTSKEIMKIFKEIAKEKTIILVTHDESYIDSRDNVIRLKSGKVEGIQISSEAAAVSISNNKKVKKLKPSLSIKSAFSQSMKNLKGMFGKFAITSLILMLCSNFLLLNFSGSVVTEQQKVLNELINQYGDTLLNLDIIARFSSGIPSRKEGETDEEYQERLENIQDQDVMQDTGEIINHLKDDPRVESITGFENLFDVEISIDGISNGYSVERSHQKPIFNKLLYGKMPDPNKLEILIPNILAEKLTDDPQSLIGKKMSLSGHYFEDDNIVEVEVEIVGIADTTNTFVLNNGEKREIAFEDSFVSSIQVSKALREAAGRDTENISASVRVRDLPSVIEISDELAKENFIALGMFQKVEDIIRLNSTTTEQSGSMINIMTGLAVFVLIALVLINIFVRRSEYALLKLNGYSKNSIIRLTMMEGILQSVIAVAGFVVTLPFISKIIESKFNMSLGKDLNTIILGTIIVLSAGLVTGIIGSILASTTKPDKNIRMGEQ